MATTESKTMAINRDSDDPRVLIFRIIGLSVQMRCTRLGGALIGRRNSRGGIMYDETKENRSLPENAPRGSGRSQIGDKSTANRGVYR